MTAVDTSGRTTSVDMRGTNTELVPKIWLWFTFLRTGLPDVFRLAEAMTRNTGEVDVYHLGRFMGLGSRS